MLHRQHSLLTQQWNEMELPIDQQQIEAWRKTIVPIEVAFPQLTTEQREFLLSGATSVEWATALTPAEKEHPARRNEGIERVLIDKVRGPK